jgi:methylation protein EvaC
MMLNGHDVNSNGDITGFLSSSDQCRFCQKDIEPFMSLGHHPLPQPSTLPSVPRAELRQYEIKPAICYSCGLFQLVDVPHPGILFHDDYPYLTGSSELVKQHYSRWAGELMSELRGKINPLVVEIGSNDGTMLCNFATPMIRHLGVEPACNVASIAESRNLRIIKRFFNAEVARDIQREHGKARLIVAANVLAHIPSLLDVIEGLSLLLDEDGLFSFESIYLGDIVRNNMFDQLYGEHVFTFSLKAVQNIFARFNLDVVDVQHQDTQGGSMRYTVAHGSMRKPTENVRTLHEEEKRFELFSPQIYKSFARRVYSIRDELSMLLVDLRSKGHKIAGYGASAKGTTVINWCKIDNGLVEFVADNTPSKQGTVVPGTSIPIVSPQYFRDQRPAFALLLAWNHRKEIELKEQQFRRGGGKWILYVPTVGIE